MTAKSLYIMVAVFLIVGFLFACDSGNGYSTNSSSLTRHVLTLKDFWDDPDLTADFRNLVAVAFRETPNWVILPEGCSGDCMAIIPYHVDQTVTLGFQWPGLDGIGTYVTMTDGMGEELFQLGPGDGEVRIVMSPGDYFLQILRADKTNWSIVYLLPQPDIDTPYFNSETTPYPNRLVFHSGECTDCNLSGGNFFQAFMADSHLEGGNLSGANLFQANLDGSSLSEINLDGANVYQAKLNSAKLEGASLAGANVFQSDFSEAVLLNTSMLGINAPEACFSKANMQNADISGAVLGYVNAEQSDFSGANLKGTILIYSILTDADFIGANLSEADLTGATITGADFTGADLTNATWINGKKCTGSSVLTCQ